LGCFGGFAMVGCDGQALTRLDECEGRDRRIETVNQQIVNAILAMDIAKYLSETLPYGLMRPVRVA
jgi:hypothetical protein